MAIAVMHTAETRDGDYYLRRTRTGAKPVGLGIDGLPSLLKYMCARMPGRGQQIVSTGFDRETRHCTTRYEYIADSWCSWCAQCSIRDNCLSAWSRHSGFCKVKIRLSSSKGGADSPTMQQSIPPILNMSVRVLPFHRNQDIRGNSRDKQSGPFPPHHHTSTTSVELNLTHHISITSRRFPFFYWIYHVLHTSRN